MYKFILVMLSINLMFLTSNLLYSQKSNSQVRMKLVGYYNGDTKDIRTNEDWKQEGTSDYVYSVGKTCITINSLVLTGNHKNVKITVCCGADGTILFSKSKIDIKGKYKINWKNIDNKFYNKCNTDTELQFSVIVVDIESDEEIYRGEVTSGDCEG
jgi:hypothetical protein